MGDVISLFGSKETKPLKATASPFRVTDIDFDHLIQHMREQYPFNVAILSLSSLFEKLSPAAPGSKEEAFLAQAMFSLCSMLCVNYANTKDSHSIILDGVLFQGDEVIALYTLFSIQNTHGEHCRVSDYDGLIIHMDTLIEIAEKHPSIVTVTTVKPLKGKKYDPIAGVFFTLSETAMMFYRLPVFAEFIDYVPQEG